LHEDTINAEIFMIQDFIKKCKSINDTKVQQIA